MIVQTDEPEQQHHTAPRISRSDTRIGIGIGIGQQPPDTDTEVAINNNSIDFDDDAQVNIRPAASRSAARPGGDAQREHKDKQVIITRNQMH